MATEVIYSTRFTAEAVKKHLGQFLRHYPDLIATVDQIWQGSTKDYVVLEQIIVQLKKEVAEATIRMSHAKQHRWGKERESEDREDHAPNKNKGKGKAGKGKGRRGSGTDAEKEKELKTEDTRQRSASESDIPEGWKKKNPLACWKYYTTGTCEFGNDCRFDHDKVRRTDYEGPSRTGRGSNSTQQSTSQNTSTERTVRYAQEDAEDRSEDEDEDQDELVARLRKENAELRGRWLELCPSCSDANPNPAEHGWVGSVLRTKGHRRAHKKTVSPETTPMTTLAKSGGTLTEKGGQDELGWTVVCRKPKSRKEKQHVVHGTYNAPKLFLDHPHNPHPNHPLTLKAKSVKPKQARSRHPAFSTN